ncbi:hypothetical protein [Natrinema hispanicum]|nr:hypothetical protein [Natrinema hispanicum]
MPQHNSRASCVHSIGNDSTAVLGDKETEPLDPDTDYSDVSAENTPLSSQSLLKALPDALADSGETRPLNLAEAADAYRTELRESEDSQYYCDRKKRADRHYHKLLQTDRFKIAEYSNPHTVMLSLRVDPVMDGVRIPPVNLFEAVKDSWQKIQERLRYQLSYKLGLDYEYAAIVAGTDHWATPHLHIYLWIDGEVDKSAFHPAVDAFVEDCKYAPDDGTGNEINNAVTIRGPQEQEFATDDVNKDLLEQRGAATTGAHYVASQIPHISHPEEASESELLHGATTVAAQSKAVHFSTGCWSEGDGETPREGSVTMDYSDITSESSDTPESNIAPTTHTTPLTPTVAYSVTLPQTVEQLSATANWDTSRRKLQRNVRRGKGPPSIMEYGMKESHCSIIN